MGVKIWGSTNIAEKWQYGGVIIVGIDFPGVNIPKVLYFIHMNDSPVHPFMYRQAG